MKDPFHEFKLEEFAKAAYSAVIRAIELNSSRKDYPYPKTKEGFKSRLRDSDETREEFVKAFLAYIGLERILHEDYCIKRKICCVLNAGRGIKNDHLIAQAALGLGYLNHSGHSDKPQHTLDLHDRINYANAVADMKKKNPPFQHIYGYGYVLGYLSRSDEFKGAMQKFRDISDKKYKQLGLERNRSLLLQKKYDARYR